MNKNSFRLAMLATISLSATSIISTAVAQDSGEIDGEEVTKRLERVTVTSRKVEESLADAPVSVLAVDGDALTAGNITEIEDLALLAPGLTFGESANSRGRGIQVRGIGTSQFGDGVEASVATYVDGVVLGRQAMSINDLIDIERVEVLRGPQGTLFGKNASAGVINIVTKAPDMEKFGVVASVSYANQTEDDAAETKIGASVTGPIIEDTLAFRLTGYSNDRDGYYTNVNTGNDFNDKKEYGFRGKLLFTPNADLEILLAADYANRDQNCCIASALRYGSSRSTNPLFSPIIPGPRNSDVFIDREDEWVQDQEQSGISAEINWDVGDLTFTSITAHRAYNGLDNNEFDLNPPGFGNDITRNDADVEQDQFTQEFRVANQGDGPLNYVAGLYYFDQSIVAQTDLLVALAAFGGAEGGNIVDRAVDTKSYAVFGQLDYSLTDNLVLLTGLRYTSEELDYSFERITNPRGLFPFNPPIQFDGSTSDDALSGLLGLQYFMGEQMVYATWSRGYKGQAVNVVNGISQVEVDNGLEIAGPEVPTNIEIGARTEWFNGRLFLDATLYDTEFEDYQVSVFDPDTNTSGLRNAAVLKSTGLELNFSALLTDELTISGAATLMDAKFDNFPGAPCFPLQGVAGGCVDVDGSGTQNAGDVQDLSGVTLRNAPDLSYSFSANYARPITSSGWALNANASLFWRDEVTFSFNGDPNALDGSHTRVNASVGVESPNGTIRASLFAKNLFDEEYPLTVLSAGSGDPGGSNQFLSYDYARVIGLRLDLSL